MQESRKIYSPLFSPMIQDQLEFEEGKRNNVYYDSKGILTGGIGHNYQTQPNWPDSGTPLPHTLTDAECYKLLGLDLLHTEKYLKSYWDHYSKMQAGPRKDAILAMSFQLGVVSFMGFTNFRMQVEHGHWEDAAKAGLASKWAKEDSPDRAARVMRQLTTGKYYEVPPKHSEEK